MAMIKCSECGNKVSDKAEKCPKCGCPIKDTLELIKEKEEKKKAKKEEKEQKKKRLTKQQKTRIVVGAIILGLIIAVSVFLVIRYTVIIPRQEAYDKYCSSVGNLNNEIELYNVSIQNYNTKANEVIASNESFVTVINDAQAVADSGNLPYEGETLLTLNNTLKTARTAKIETPTLYENKELYVVDETLSNKSVDVINSKTLEVDNALSQIAQERTSVEENTSVLEIPDYSKYITDIENDLSAFEDSCKIQTQVTAPSEEWVLERLGRVELIANIAAVTEDHDPNGKLNKAGGYTATLYFSTSLLSTESLSGYDLIEEGTDAGGGIEVYATVEDAQARNEYLSAFDGSWLDSGSHMVLGTMVVRTSSELKASEQELLTNQIINIFIEP